MSASGWDRLARLLIHLASDAAGSLILTGCWVPSRDQADAHPAGAAQDVPVPRAACLLDGDGGVPRNAE